MKQSVFHISQMDCPSEESLIRLKLGGINGIHGLSFDLEKRELTVAHEAQILENLSTQLESLKLGSRLVSSGVSDGLPVNSEVKGQRKLLWTVLLINFAFFVLEAAFGWISGSMGLVADSLDMLADAGVYGLSLLAVGAAVQRQKQVAGIAGIFQVALAILGFAEVVRRFFGYEELPDFRMMMAISFFALLANAYCLYLLQKSKSSGAHLKASMIFTSNDIIINLGVMLAGGFVLYLDSRVPDLVIGGIVFVVVSVGAFRILRLAK